MQHMYQMNVRKRQYAEENTLKHQKENVCKQQKISNRMIWDQWLEITSKQTVLFLSSFFCLFDWYENKQLIIFGEEDFFPLGKSKGFLLPSGPTPICHPIMHQIILHRGESGTV